MPAGARCQALFPPWDRPPPIAVPRSTAAWPCLCQHDLSESGPSLTNVCVMSAQHPAREQPAPFGTCIAHTLLARLQCMPNLSPLFNLHLYCLPPTRGSKLACAQLPVTPRLTMCCQHSLACKLHAKHAHAYPPRIPAHTCPPSLFYLCLPACFSRRVQAALVQRCMWPPPAESAGPSFIARGPHRRSCLLPKWCDTLFLRLCPCDASVSCS